MSYTSPWSRFLSALTDFTVLRVVLDLESLAIPSTWLVKNGVLSGAFGIGVFITYILTRMLLHGQTIGMWLFGYRIRKNDKGKRLTFFEEILRFASQWLSMLLFFLPFVYSLFNKKSAHFSDLIVDSSPQATSSRFEGVKPLQRFLAVYFVTLAISSIYAALAPVPAMDIAARIIKGEYARIAHGVMIILSAFLGLSNLLGMKKAPLFSALFFGFMFFSSVYTMVDFDRYQYRVVQNLRETVASAKRPDAAKVNDRMLRTLLAQSIAQVRKNLPFGVRFGLMYNLMCLAYWLSLLYPSQTKILQEKISRYRIDTVNWAKRLKDSHMGEKR